MQAYCFHAWTMCQEKVDIVEMEKETQNEKGAEQETALH